MTTSQTADPLYDALTLIAEVGEMVTPKLRTAELRAANAQFVAYARALLRAREESLKDRAERERKKFVAG